MHPDTLLAIFAAVMVGGFIFALIIILYFVFKNKLTNHIKKEQPEEREAMLESHIKKEQPEEREPLLESHIEKEQPEEKERRFDVKYKELFTASLVCGIIAGIFSGFPDLQAGNMFCCMWVVLGGGGAVFLLRSSIGSKDKLRIEKAILAGGLTGVIAALVLFPVEYIFEASQFSRFELGSVVLAMPALFIFGALGGVVVNEVLP